MKYSVLALTLALSMSASAVALAEDKPIVIDVATHDAKAAVVAANTTTTGSPIVKQVASKAAETHSLTGAATRPKNLDQELRNR